MYTRAQNVIHTHAQQILHSRHTQGICENVSAKKMPLGAPKFQQQTKEAWMWVCGGGGKRPVRHKQQITDSFLGKFPKVRNEGEIVNRNVEQNSAKADK